MGKWLSILVLMTTTLPALASSLNSDSTVSEHINRGDWHHYTLPVTQDMQQITIQLTGLSADADLYVRKHKRPSRWFWRWHCRPYESGNRDEQCQLSNTENYTLHISVYGARSTNYTLSVSSTAPQPETVYLLLHGLNSDPDTWNAVNDELFDNQCRTLQGDDRDLNLPTVKCYRYHFKTRTTNGEVWENGDGSNYHQLGQEVGLALSSLEQVANPTSVIIIGHSRGGLSARAYLQSDAFFPTYPIGLLTIGTPHQGSPFGLIKHWMNLKGYGRRSIFFSALHFVVSPSTGYLTTVLDDTGLPAEDTRANAINTLNRDVSSLSGKIDVFGQITSTGLDLGENSAGYLDLLHNTKVAFILPGSIHEMRDYIEQNLHHPEWKTGDGIVPYASQQMQNIPGFDTGGAPLWHGQLSRIPHADATQFDFWDSNPNDGETGQVHMIHNVLKKMTQSNGFTPF